MNKAEAWGIVQRVTENFEIDRAALIDAGKHSWGPGRDDAKPAAFEAWIRRCLSRSRGNGVRNPVGLFLEALKEGPDRDLSATPTGKPMQNAAAYQEFQPYDPEPGSEPGWSVDLSTRIYQHAAYGGRKPTHFVGSLPIEAEEAGKAAVRAALDSWVAQGRPDLQDFDWKQALEHLFIEGAASV